MGDVCQERERLREALLVATSAIDTAVLNLESARKRKDGNAQDIAAVLRAARSRAREVQRALMKHEAEHQCGWSSTGTGGSASGG